MGQNKVDIKTHECFPTLIHEFKLALDHTEMLDYVHDTGQIHQSQENLHKLHIFKPLVNELTLIHESIIQKLEYQYDKIEITGMWSNHLYSGNSHRPHTHSNSFLSGVYYLLAGKNTAPIQFFDPRVQASILGPRKKNNNWYNSDIASLNSVNSYGFIFPSWLQHWVPPTQDERISISWNVLIRGHYGDPKTFQNAYI